jgi:hypothetical protein
MAVTTVTWPTAAAGCSSLVASMCDGASTSGGTHKPERVIVAPRAPAFATGDRFPVEGQSMLMNPDRYGLPPVDGSWRYYAFDGYVYRVNAQTAEVLEVISNSDVIGRLP